MAVSYYDLIASLPHLPHFEKAEHLPTTRLRLNQRLALLEPDHADQLERALTLVRWRPERLIGQTDRASMAKYSEFLNLDPHKALREYVTFRMDQLTVLSALRCKRDDRTWLEVDDLRGVGSRVHFIRRNWDVADFGLTLIVPWLPKVRELLDSGDARGLERVLMNVAWRWLAHCADRNTFGFEAVFSYVFRWDILKAWLASSADRAKTRFTQLVDEVTDVGRN